MKKLLFLLTFALGTGAAQAQVKFETKSTDAVREMAIKQGKLVFIDLYASWWPPCRMMERQVFRARTSGSSWTSGSWRPNTTQTRPRAAN